jgi:hypothetical protein
MHDPASSGQDGKLDLVPMIDCIMLLLLFFILTTRFTAPELALAAVLPTDQGPGTPANPAPVPPPRQVAVAIYPDGLDDHRQPSEYQVAWERLSAGDDRGGAAAVLRIGGSDPLRLDGAALGRPDSPELREQLALIQRFVADELRQRETAGGRKDQAPIGIACFSGLPWRYAVVVYDAVRAFELERSGGIAATVESLADARQVTLAPPRVRDYSRLELGDELEEIVNQR